MPQVIIDNLASKTIECPDKSKRLLDVLLEETDWMHACGAKGRCTTCKAKVLSGMENLGELSDAELRYIGLNKLQSDERLTCQVEVSGDVRILVPEEYKLPHLKYS